jgi:hypothetical protein
MDGDFCVNRSLEASFSRSAGVFAGAQAKQKSAMDGDFCV